MNSRKPLLIENIYEKETTESYIERHFRDRAIHRCRAVAEFDVAAIAEQYQSDLVRSGQELEINPMGTGHRPKWTMLVFRRSPHLLWHFLVKSGPNYGTKEPDQEYTLTVSADSAHLAAQEALMLQKQFTNDDNAPGFYMVREINKPRRMPLKAEYSLSPEWLELHYGEGFAEWTERFVAGLAENGLSILRGKPGTGKTSFLRHVIYTFSESHRFYYLPVDAFGLLQAQMAEFLRREQKRFPKSSLVIVLEDAEQLLLDRRGFRDGLASSLLNFTDGFVGDLVKAHLICTINSDVQELDEAVLRPGRQRFFREFETIPWERAAQLAAKLEITLEEKRSYTLAEIYHYKDVQNQDRAQKPGPRVIGFAQS